jgi:enoyl-CoA hydratase/carnithine racemase
MDAPAPMTVVGDVSARVVRLGRERNEFDDAFVAAFHAALDAIEAEATAAPVVTVGAGKSFSNGFDLDHLGRLEGDALWQFVEQACGLLGRILTFPAPTVAALNGHAFGIGGMLALAHDQRVMRADRGWFCLPEVDLGLGFHPFMLALVAGRLPARTAQEAILTGRRYDAAAAVEAGIVDAAAPESDLLAAAVARTEGWTGKRPETLAALKAQLHAAIVTTLPR